MRQQWRHFTGLMSKGQEFRYRLLEPTQCWSLDCPPKHGGQRSTVGELVQIECSSLDCWVTVGEFLLSALTPSHTLPLLKKKYNCCLLLCNKVTHMFAFLWSHLPREPRACQVLPLSRQEKVKYPLRVCSRQFFLLLTSAFPVHSL